MKQPQLFMALGRALLGASLLFLCQCSAQSVRFDHGLIDRLNGRGPVALSTDNPYLAANLFLGREMENSIELKGFIQHRGAPAAIEISKGFFEPLQLLFYYPKEHQYFSLEDSAGTWIISGPFTISADKSALIVAATAGVTGKPNLTIEKRAETPAMQSEASPNVSRAAPVLFPTPLPSATVTATATPLPLPSDSKASLINEEQNELRRQEFPGAFQSSPRAPSSPAPQALSTKSASPQTLEEYAAADHHPAELTPKGDLVHYVTLNGETLSLIARWYTFDKSNAGKIARINQLKDPDVLNVGDTIVIPNYLVKNKNRLSAEAIALMKKEK